ncbi:MAG: PLP-dependent aspartate aminotransferase family protein [Polyangia bacterium]
MKTLPTHHIDTLAVHAGQEPEPRTGAISTPVFLTSTYVQDGPGGHKGYEYSRTHNPTREAMERNIAALEGGRFGIAFASGCAATTTILHTLSAGDHVIAGDDLYGGTFRIFERVMKQFGLRTTYVDPTRPEAFAAAIEPSTKMVWVETPTNPLLKLCDLSAVAALCKQHGLTFVVDNTFMSPMLQRPLDLGAALVVHSSTKYLNGHADVVGGIAVTNDGALHERLRFLQNAIGAVPSPMDSFLILRGTKTLHLRMERHSRNALQLATWLESLSTSSGGLIERVVYPGLPSHPQHALAQQQLLKIGGQVGGGMITFFVRDGERPALQRAVNILRSVRLIACAESLGGVESLIEHPATMTHASIPVEQRNALGISDGLIRLSVGVESVDDLRADLEQAFGRADL